MIRCVRMWTGEDGDSPFEEGSIEPRRGMRGESVGGPFRPSSLPGDALGGSFEWPEDPVPNCHHLSGTLEFETKSGARS